MTTKQMVSEVKQVVLSNSLPEEPRRMIRSVLIMRVIERTNCNEWFVSWVDGGVLSEQYFKFFFEAARAVEELLK